MIKLVECPRDAMQGLHTFIETEDKARYINKLLTVGFDTIDFGSFVSPKAIPQLKDTEAVLRLLNLETTKSKLLAIVANKRGAEDACRFNEIDYLGFPFSVSETFQQRNTNSSIDQSLARVEEIQRLCHIHQKKMVVYLSMGFGNPYGETWNPDIVTQWAARLVEELNVEIIAPSDTIGVSAPSNITPLFNTLITSFPQVEFGAHLHSTPTTALEKIEATLAAGCKRIDSAILGLGGCPMAKDDLTGNMATEQVVQYAVENKLNTGIDAQLFAEAMAMAPSIFPNK
jgi:hydroxymethylglutaryl-CoA lyase